MALDLVNGGLIAALAGLGIGAGFLWWKKRAEAASGPMSNCKAACIIAAKASGTTGDLDALCGKACGFLDGIGATQWAGGIVDGIKGIGEAKDPRVSVFDSAFGSANGARCPAGSTFVNGGALSDHRTGTDSYGSCVDASGKPIGTVSRTGTFTPYAPTFAPTVPVRMPTATTPEPETHSWSPIGTTSDRSAGGVTVTTR